METKFWVICLSMLLVSCSRNVNDIYTGGKGEPDDNGKEEIKKENFFDFSTTRSNQLVIDYGINGQTVFYLYDEYPLELIENTWEFKDISPIYAAATGEDGKFSSEVHLPAYLNLHNS